MKLILSVVVLMLLSSGLAYAQSAQDTPQERTHDGSDTQAGADCDSCGDVQKNATNVPPIAKNRTDVVNYVASLVQGDNPQAPKGSGNSPGDK